MAGLLTLLTLLLLSGVECRKNVLFLASDDMRPQLGVYEPTGNLPKAHTPNLDALAGRSLLLKNAFVQQAVCNPSRTSILTGRRPDTTRVYDLRHYWRKQAGNFTTIPQYFKENGYRTFGIGKIFHPGMLASGRDDPISWTERYQRPQDHYWSNLRLRLSWLSVNESILKEHKLPDQQIAEAAVNTLKKLGERKGDKPFFLATGFKRPHLPFIVPSRFYDMYPLKDMKLPTNPFAPVDMPEAAWSNYAELRVYDDIKFKYGHGSINTTLPLDVTLNLRRGYMAAISYTDSLIGEVLAELERQGLANETIVTFWGDHGWQLGEHGEWCKHTNFELSTHAPMMMHIPGVTNAGVVTEALTEFVDLFPSLAEAADLPPIPTCPEDSTQVLSCTEGTSFLPLIKNPSQPWKDAVFSQYPRMAIDGDHVMGYSMRTQRFRYTQWVFHTGWPDYQPQWKFEDEKHSEELYDHSTDPDENINVEGRKEYAKIKKQLSAQLHAGWRKAHPTPSISAQPSWRKANPAISVL